MRTVRLGLWSAGVAVCGLAAGAGSAAAQARWQPQPGEQEMWRQQQQQRGPMMEQPGAWGQQPRMREFSPRVTPEQRRALANHNADITSPITRQNAPQLSQAWRVQTEANVTHAPLVSNGRVYFADWGGNVYCVNLDDGEEVWRRRVAEPSTDWPWHGFVGTGALGEGGEVLYLASVEGTVYALSTEDGETIWEREFTEQEHAGSTGKLLYHRGLLFIGLSSVEEFLHGEREGFEPSFRGRVMALDARGGDLVWDAQLVREPSNGVAVWGGFALDPETQTLYFATGNNFTGEPSSLSNAVLAVEASSGELLWAQQTTPNDVWTMGNPQGPGFAFMAAPQLFNAVVDGRQTRLVGAGQKNGTFWAWDRQSGQPVWATPVGYGHIGGGIFAEASIGRDRIFITGNNAYAFENPDQHPADIKAVDAASGRPLWVKSRVQPAQLTSTGFLAGDVYFAGSLDGRVRAYSARDGEEVWSSGQHASIASPIRAEGRAILFGTGLPERMGGREGEGRGVFCYRVDRPETEAAGDRPRARPVADRLRPDGAQPAPARNGEGEQGRQIRITARDGSFEPAEIRVQPGETVTILLVNDTQGRHSIEFALPDGRRASPEEVVAPGRDGRVTFTAPREPGRYTFICPVGDHAERGMKGTLIVEERESDEEARRNGNNDRRSRRR